MSRDFFARLADEFDTIVDRCDNALVSDEECEEFLNDMLTEIMEELEYTYGYEIIEDDIDVELDCNTELRIFDGLDFDDTEVNDGPRD